MQPRYPAVRSKATPAAAQVARRVLALWPPELVQLEPAQELPLPELERVPVLG